MDWFTKAVFGGKLIEKGKITPKSDFSRQVTPEGFEPPTVGAEIQYSIQLNYGAIFINDN